MIEPTPEILITALRQYRHNFGSEELFAGFDYEETCAIVSGLSKEIEQLNKLKASHEFLQTQHRLLTKAFSDFQQTSAKNIEQLKSPWIDVTERLPTEDDSDWLDHDVLILMQGKYVETMSALYVGENIEELGISHWKRIELLAVPDERKT